MRVFPEHEPPTLAFLVVESRDPTAELGDEELYRPRQRRLIDEQVCQLSCWRSLGGSIEHICFNRDLGSINGSN